MRFNFLTFFLAEIIERNRGVLGSQGTGTAILSGAVGSPLLGVLLASTIPPTPGTSATTASSGLGTSSSTGIVPIPSNIGMPSFFGMTKHHAEEWAQSLRLIPEFETEPGEPSGNFVVKQKPVVGGHIGTGRNVTLTLGNKSEL